MAPPFLLDHVVIRVNDLDAAMRDYTDLGFTVVRGGEHPGLGSRNALIAFEDGSYLELITFRSPEPRRVAPKHVRARELAGSPHTSMERHWLPWESAPEGLVDFALLPASIEDAIRDAKARGLNLEGPIPGSRQRPDGQRVAWQLALPETLDLPFLCFDVTPRALRVPEGEVRRHPNGAAGIACLEVVVRDVAVSTARYRALLGEEPATQGDPPRFSFFLGTSTVTLCAPTGPDDPRLHHANAYGEGPLILALGTSGQTAAELDRARAHNADIRLLSTTFS